MENLSVVVITYNEEKNIGRCLDSIRKIADEIIVLDSFSTDRTAEIAMAKGAIVKQKQFEGYIEQKNYALDLASHFYILSLDADEALNEMLVDSILEEKGRFSHRTYTMNRCTNYCGRYILHGSWYPDKKLRLFDKRIARWGGTNPHDKIEPATPCIARHLKGDILHFSYASIEEHIQQNNKFSTISASSLFDSGKRTNPVRMIVNPLWAFISGYFLRAGFLEGFYGFVIAVNVAHLTFLKHSKLYQLQIKNRKKQ